MEFPPRLPLISHASSGESLFLTLFHFPNVKQSQNIYFTELLWEFDLTWSVQWTGGIGPLPYSVPPGTREARKLKNGPSKTFLKLRVRRIKFCRSGALWTEVEGGNEPPSVYTSVTIPCLSRGTFSPSSASMGIHWAAVVLAPAAWILLMDQEAAAS